MAGMKGQGTALPKFLQCEGDWIAEGYLYLHWGISGNAIPGATGQFTFGARYHGEPCVGIDASQLAAALEVDRATIIAANRDCSLVFLGTAEVPPTHGGLQATAFGFRLGDRESYLTIETNPHQGTA
jgi:hypothetical protein